MWVDEYIMHASAELRALRNFDIIKPKGRGNATYYVQGDAFVGKHLQGSRKILQARLQELRARSTIEQALSRLKRHTKRGDFSIDVVSNIIIESISRFCGFGV